VPKLGGRGAFVVIGLRERWRRVWPISHRIVAFPYLEIHEEIGAMRRKAAETKSLPGTHTTKLSTCCSEPARLSKRRTDPEPSYGREL